MRIGLAGHPPPLLITDRGSEFAEAPVGPPIGFLNPITYTDHERPLNSGTPDRPQTVAGG